MSDNEQQQFEAQLAEQIPVWEMALREGYTVRQMFERTVADGPALIAGEVKRLLEDVSNGVAFTDALKQWLARRPSQDLNLLVTTLLVQRETGGNLADILQVVGHVLKKRAG